MSVNGITEVTNAYSAYASSAPKQAKVEEADDKKSAFDEVGAVYEPSKDADKNVAEKKTYTPNTEMVNKLKEVAEAREKQLRDIVEKLMNEQGKTYNVANGLKSIYEQLEVDPETRAQAQKDIAEDGYYGVDQTSSRIFDFAMALTGGDPEKMEKMKSAFQQGYAKAEKTWGGKLPEICQNTYDTVLKKFDDYKNQSAESVTAE